jgi:hypothetical protein
LDLRAYLLRAIRNIGSPFRVSTASVAVVRQAGGTCPVATASLSSMCRRGAAPVADVLASPLLAAAPSLISAYGLSHCSRHRPARLLDLGPMLSVQDAGSVVAQLAGLAMSWRVGTRGCAMIGTTSRLPERATERHRFAQSICRGVGASPILGHESLHAIRKR